MRWIIKMKKDNPRIKGIKKEIKHHRDREKYLKNEIKKIRKEMGLKKK